MAKNALRIYELTLGAEIYVEQRSRYRRVVQCDTRSCSKSPWTTINSQAKLKALRNKLKAQSILGKE